MDTLDIETQILLRDERDRSKSKNCDHLFF